MNETAYGTREYIDCICSYDKARVVQCGAGWYIRCPVCDRITIMQSCRDDALTEWEKCSSEEIDNG